jgi:anti-sigma regulatory factor (Ser/Thr protein kinase)
MPDSESWRPVQEVVASSFFVPVPVFGRKCRVDMENEFIAQGRPVDLAHVVDFIEAVCNRAGVKSEVCPDLQLAVEEACTNVIKHAYEGLGGEFSVRFQTSARDVVITVHDHGRSFDPTRVSKPDFAVPLEDRPVGGLGLHLIQRLMDEISFTFSATEGNTLVMVKKGCIPQPVPGDPARRENDG